MSFLLALAAFAAIVTVYSTVVTVIVEGLQKLLALRSSGMNEMLRALYDQTLSELHADETSNGAEETAGPRRPKPTSSAKAFADSIARNTPSASLKFWYIRNWPLVGQMFGSRRTNLTTLQFIEGLAETPEGAALARHEPGGLRNALTTIAYQYERLGETQSEYFRSRAKLISVLVGMVVAVFINFDAITVYKELSTNAELSSRLTLAMDQERLDTVRQLSAGEGTSDANPEYLALRQASGDLRTLGLPIGRKMFPHCEGYSHTDTAVVTRERNAADKNAIAVDAYVDARCGKSGQQLTNQTWSESYDEYLDRLRVKPKGWTEATGYWFKYRGQRIAAIGNNLESFLLWALGIIVAGGLLGLGAPFWFKIFGRLSSMAMPAARMALANQDPQTGVMRVTNPSEVRPSSSSDPEDLERGFKTVLNRQQVLADVTTEEGELIGRLEDAQPGISTGPRPPEGESQ